MANSFAPDGLFLFVEDEHDESCGKEDGRRRAEWVNGCSVVPKTDVTQPKRVWRRT
jgi:hypothetical protein